LIKRLKYRHTRYTLAFKKQIVSIIIDLDQICNQPDLDRSPCEPAKNSRWPHLLRLIEQAVKVLSILPRVINIVLDFQPKAGITSTFLREV
jgi:hypothetical protein